jgi:hypothetical protein
VAYAYQARKGNDGGKTGSEHPDAAIELKDYKWTGPPRCPIRPIGPADRWPRVGRAAATRTRTGHRRR